jgi:5-methylcytosine-specific restriction endonuclease McrA
MKTKVGLNARKTVPNKIRALLQQEISSQCPFCNNGDVDHFQVHHMDGNKENDDTQNLIMLCPLCHSKITKGDIKYDDVINKKKDLKNNARGDESMGEIINFNGKVDNAIVGNNTITRIFF